MKSDDLVCGLCKAIKNAMEGKKGLVIDFFCIVLYNNQKLAITNSKEIDDGRKEMKMKKIFWMLLGFIGLILGAIGAVLPMLPAFPFLLLAAFSFGKSSKKLHTWFIGTSVLTC